MNHSGAFGTARQTYCASADAAGRRGPLRTRVGGHNGMRKTVKGAPYSGEEITESLQVLADGTRIGWRHGRWSAPADREIVFELRD